MECTTIRTPLMSSTSPMEKTLARLCGHGIGITSPRTCRRAWTIGPELVNFVGSSTLPAIRRAVGEAGITPPLAVIATKLLIPPTAAIGSPVRCRFRQTNPPATM